MSIQTGDESTATQLVCYCDHMTSFAGGLLLMPNKLNWEEDIAKLAEADDNLVGIATVAAVLFVYAIAVFFARRKDKMDYLRVSFHYNSYSF
jgi:hypothetical protein